MGSLRGFYERVDRSCPRGAHRVEVELQLLESVVGRAGRAVRVLDLGCGDGAIADLAAKRVPGSRIVALDWAHGALDSVRERGLTGVLASLDGTPLPFRSHAFDVVLMSEVIEHLVDPDLAVSEARRVLVPGGTLLLSTPNLAAWFNRLLLLGGVQPVFSEVSTRGVFGRPGSVVVGHLRLFTARALPEVLRACGFVEVDLFGAAYHDVPRGARWLDHLLTRRPSVAAILLARARAPEDGAG